MDHIMLKYISKKRDMLKKIYQEDVYMCTGEYVLDNTLRYLYMNDVTNNSKAYCMFGKNYIKPSFKVILFLIKKLYFRKNMIIDNKKKCFDDFQGTVCYMGIVNNSSKIFDFTNNKVLTVFTNKDKYLNTLNHYRYFKNYFPLPEILYNNEKELVIMEEFIEYKSCNTWTEQDYNEVMENVFEWYLRYFIKAKSTSNYSNTLLTSLVEDEDEVNNYIRRNTDEEIMKVKFPFLKLHGDLWAPNILINYGNNIHFIDFEYASNYIFFYDFFWLITEQAIFNNNYILIDKYFSGAYDDCFNKIFKVFDMVFNNDNRLDYLNVFFLNFSVKRWSQLKRENRARRFSEYKNLIKMIKSCYIL